MFRYLLSLLILLKPIYSNPKVNKLELKREIDFLIQKQEYSLLIGKLENFLQNYPYEKKYELYLARSYLLNPIKDLTKEDDPFQKEEKRKQIKEQYEKARAIYSKALPEWEFIAPNDRNLGYWYFEWALVEHILGNKEKAISLYKKSSSFHEFPKEAFYNSGVLLIDLGLLKDAKKQLQKFYSKATED